MHVLTIVSARALPFIKRDFSAPQRATWGAQSFQSSRKLKKSASLGKLATVWNVGAHLIIGATHIF